MPYNAKNIILHVGTSGLQNGGVKGDEFDRLLSVATNTWKDANIYVSLITSRKDMAHEDISEENRCIKAGPIR